jgi:hypothetical protein
VTLVLNEQTETPTPGHTVTYFGPIAVNAIHLYSKNLEVIVGHSSCTT